jgi:poly-gamma-glutamate capsule biosynthesis protein CapA/YwtB (metallophosphatase superfamily)
MQINRRLVRIFLVTAFLTGCVSPFGSLPGAISSPVDSATRTPFLPATTATFPPTVTHMPEPTTTASQIPTLTPTPSFRVELQAVGDIMLARTVGDQLQAKGPGIVFAGVQSVFDTADVLVGNLECAITSAGQPQEKSFTFAAPPLAAQALALAGFDVLSLANNHAMDYGTQGLLDTRANLDQAGITSVGAGADASAAHTPVLLEVNGLRLAFLAYVDVPVEKGGFDARAWIATATQPGIAWADLDRIKADVTSAKARADVVIVQLHSGYEISSYIPPVSTDQRTEAYAAIDAGAAMVIGSHSHVLEPIERYHGGLIAFSLGNFVFDGYWGIVNSTVILRVILTPAGVDSYDWIPVLIEKGLPQLTTNKEAPVIGTMVAPRITEIP